MKYSEQTKETLKRNFNSLEKVLCKYCGKLDSVKIGNKLFGYIPSSINYLEEIYNVKLIRDPRVEDTRYEMIFLDEAPSEFKSKNLEFEMQNLEDEIYPPEAEEYPEVVENFEPFERFSEVEPLKDEEFVGKKVVITESRSRSLKRELKKYLGKVGTCILALEKQEQRVVTFEDNTTIAFRNSNVKLYEDKRVLETEVQHIYSMGENEIENLDNSMGYSKKEIEKYLRKNRNAKELNVLTRYYLK